MTFLGRAGLHSQALLLLPGKTVNSIQSASALCLSVWLKCLGNICSISDQQVLAVDLLNVCTERLSTLIKFVVKMYGVTFVG